MAWSGRLKIHTTLVVTQVINHHRAEVLAEVVPLVIGGSGLASAGFICGLIIICHTIVEDPSEPVGNEQQ